MDLPYEEKIRAIRQQYLDLKEYQSRFLLTPEVESEADFSHLDKNLAITNLKHHPKIGLDEPEEARAILKSLHILNNTKYYREEEVKVLAGYKDKDNGDGTITRIPIYTTQKKRVSKFPKTYHALKSRFISLVNTSAARNGHRIDKAISNKLIQENTLKQKTDVKSRLGFNRKEKDDYYS